MDLPPAVPTVGSIAAVCNVPVHRVRYVIESRRIEPAGRAGNARVFAPADVERIRNELARIAGGPATGDKLDTADLDRLFRWQEKALDAWEASGRRGIVEAMTGSGKTLVALKAIKRLVAAGYRLSPLIVVPTVALLDQWYHKLQEMFPGAPVARLGDGSHGDFSSAGAGGALPVACVATVHSAVPAVEQGLFDHCRAGPGRYRSLLVADECHRYLDEDQRLFNRILRHRYDFTLGLSATIGGFEVPGLGKIVYTYGIGEAVRDGVIPHFDVLNVGVELSCAERWEYLELTKLIRDLGKRLARRYGDPDLAQLKVLLRTGDDPLVSAFFGYIFKRAAISYTAAAKLQLVPQIIDLLVQKARRKMLVFFERIRTAEGGQADVARRFAEQVRDAVATAADGRDPVWCKLFHSEMPDRRREAVLEEFRSVGPSALLACRALDEGLDVPEVEAALLVASTQSPRQRLQRIGRTLRRGDGRKRPLIVILYVKETSDSNVRIDQADPDFQGAATIYDAEPRQCLSRIAQILKQPKTRTLR